jgi:hypothetical protein
MALWKTWGFGNFCVTLTEQSQTNSELIANCITNLNFHCNYCITMLPASIVLSAFADKTLFVNIAFKTVFDSSVSFLGS